MKGEALCWGPFYKALESQLQAGDGLLLIVSPFVTLEALQRLLEKQPDVSDLKVVVRWRPEDVRNGVSDIHIYPYLVERNIPLYLNFDIHLKLYVFESNHACSTSANLTLRGLGYVEKSNLEVGQFLGLQEGDWLRLYSLLESSRRVDDVLYDAYASYLERCPAIEFPSCPELTLAPRHGKYSISSLPAMNTPSRFMECYLTGRFQSKDEIRRTAHDIAVFHIAAGLEAHDLGCNLRQAFRNTAFVIEFVELLKREKSLRFGAVNAWIHERCDDVPLPYRWEIKENTRILYNWLEYFFEEVSWDRPNISQIIRWKG